MFRLVSHGVRGHYVFIRTPFVTRTSSCKLNPRCFVAGARKDRGGSGFSRGDLDGVYSRGFRHSYRRCDPTVSLVEKIFPQVQQLIYFIFQNLVTTQKCITYDGYEIQTNDKIVYHKLSKLNPLICKLCSTIEFPSRS